MNALLAVAIQVFTVVYIASTGPLVPAGNVLLHVLFLGGLLLMAAAVWVMREEEWYTPDLHAKARLVTWGPYAVVRHPMYLGLLLAVGSMVAYAPSMDRWIALLVLFVDLWYRISSEEAALATRFPTYKAYMKKTKRFIPYII